MQYVHQFPIWFKSPLDQLTKKRNFSSNSALLTKGGNNSASKNPLHKLRPESYKFLETSKRLKV